MADAKEPKTVNFAASGKVDGIKAALAASALPVDLIAVLIKEVEERGAAGELSVTATVHDNPDSFSISANITAPWQ